MVRLLRWKTIWGVLLLLYLFGSCSKSSNSTVYLSPSSTSSKLTSASIYGSMSIQEIIDSLYSDTLRMRDYFDSTQTDTFYQNRIEQLVVKLQKDGNDSLTLFPECTFDKVVAKDVSVRYANNQFFTSYGLGKELNNRQIEILMSIVNNPLHFSWGECGTWTPSSKFDFYYKGKVVRTLDVGCGWQFKSDFEKIKFGTLAGRSPFFKLCKELELNNDPFEI